MGVPGADVAACEVGLMAEWTTVAAAADLDEAR